MVADFIFDTIVTDLDGPILDTKYRHYACYKEILGNNGYTPIEIEDYWKLKRNRVDRLTLLKLSGAFDLYDTFLVEWLRIIEEEEFLQLDELQAGAVRILGEWRATAACRIVLATMRHDPTNLYRELDRLAITHLFDQIIVCDYRDGGAGKAERVRQSLDSLDATRCVWIGDTEADIEASMYLGVKSVAVSCGLRTSSFLQSLGPDALVPHLRDVNLGLL